MKINNNHFQTIWVDDDKNSINIIDPTLLPHEFKIINLEDIVQFFTRRKKIFLLTSSLVFSLLFINTIKKYFNEPVYQGNFSMLIKDPIDGQNPTRGNIVERLAFNETFSELPT